jgi:hypothetical protein
VTSQLLLYNGALRELGERKLQTLADAVASRRFLDQAWSEGFIAGILSDAQWKFAIRTVKMQPDSSLTPNFGYNFGFSRPTDFVRTVMVASDEFFRIPYTQYVEEAGNFFTVLQVWYLAYVSNDISYGGDIGAWPQSVHDYAAAKLADKILPQMTGNKTDAMDLAKRVKRFKDVAQSQDAMENPTKWPPPGSWVRARMRGRTGGDRGNRNQLYG